MEPILYMYIYIYIHIHIWPCLFFPCFRGSTRPYFQKNTNIYPSELHCTPSYAIVPLVYDPWCMAHMDGIKNGILRGAPPTHPATHPPPYQTKPNQVHYCHTRSLNISVLVFHACQEESLLSLMTNTQVMPSFLDKQTP